jgi:hypothetical protein
MSRPRFLSDHDLNEHIVMAVVCREPSLEWIRVRDVGLKRACRCRSLSLCRRTWVCATCDRLLSARLAVSRTVDSMVGSVQLERPYFYCCHCQQGKSPLDEALDLALMISDRHTKMLASSGRMRG